jgi:hypothetical protein
MSILAFDHRASRASRNARGRLLAFLVAAVGLAPGVAHAQASDADRATARSLAQEGYDAQQRTQYAVAADRFARADALVHAPTLLLGLARAQVGLGKLVEAEETYQRIARETLPANAPPAFSRAVEEAKSEVTALAPRLAWVTIDVGAASSPSEVTLDGVAVPVAAIGVRRACNPGKHTIKASAAGFAPAEKTFVATEGNDQRVSLTMEALAAPPPPSPSPAPVLTEQPPASMSVSAKVAIASFAVGAAGLITGSVAGILVLSKHSSLVRDCPDDTCNSPSAKSEYSTYRSLATVADAGWVVAGVGAAVGVTLLIAAPNGNSVSAYVGPASAGVVGTF